MTLPGFLEPENARITIPVMLAIGYAAYHVWRWRMMHPKIIIEDLPEPASEAKSVIKTGAATASAPTAEPARNTAATKDLGAKPSAASTEAVKRHTAPHQSRSRWRARREQEYFDERLNQEAGDAGAHERAYYKATNGRPEYFVKLGRYAWLRGAMVEAHFWLTMAKLNGVEGLDEWLGHIRNRWIQIGRPMERHNIYDQYPFERGALAYAYIMVACGFSVSINSDCIRKMAHLGDNDAQLIFDKMVV